MKPEKDVQKLSKSEHQTKMELANRLFFRFYQCANMLHKTGSRAVEAEGLTTQQWAVLGALSRAGVKRGMRVGDLARYLMVSRQNLSELLGRMEKAGHLELTADPDDGRSKLIGMTESGRKVWKQQALPKIYQYYDEVLADFSINDTAHALHYVLKILENMKRVDQAGEGSDPDSAAPAVALPVAGRKPRRKAGG